MKRYIFLILFIFFVCTITAQRYLVYKTSGNVTLCHKNATVWQKTGKRDKLELSDRLNIPKGASLSVIDNESTQIYRNTGSGLMTVKELVDKAKKNNNSVISNLNTELADNKLKSKKSVSYTSLGVSSRGLGSQEMYKQMKAAIASHHSQKENYGPKLKTKTVSEDELEFEIINGLNSAVMVNVIRLDTVTGKMALCFACSEAEANDLLILDSEESVRFPNILFSPLSENEIFIPFATSFSYNPATLLKYLNKPVDNDILGKIQPGIIFIGTNIN